MTDPTSELEQIYGTDIYCNICGDTGFIHGDKKYGICTDCREEELTLADVVETITELKEKAEYRSRMIIDNGREITDVDRARSAGYADAYSFCLTMLRLLEESQ